MGYEVIWDAHGVTKLFFDHVVAAELLECSSIVQADERFENVKRLLLDFQDCLSHSVSEPDLLEIAAIDNMAAVNRERFGKRKMRVAIVAKDSAILELAQRYGNHRLNAGTTGIFVTREDALTWLSNGY